jgi:NADPH:quinone reductase-like Zn-dependent oxidoreductase
MKAVGYRVAGPITAPDSLVDLELPTPVPGPRDLRVSVRAISVNPADVQIRARVSPPNGDVRILGFDASGIVDAVGSEVTLFKPGDEVFYAGAMNRPGTNSELHLVGVGAAVRAACCAIRGEIPDRRAIDHQRRGRRRIDADTASSPADRPDDHCNGIPSGNRGMVP